MAKGFLDGYKTYDTSLGFGNSREWSKALQERMSKDEAYAIMQQQPETPYTILGIDEAASQTEIKKAFRKAINEWHPDKNQHRLEEAEAMSKKIIAAYIVLTK